MLTLLLVWAMQLIEQAQACNFANLPVSIAILNLSNEQSQAIEHDQEAKQNAGNLPSLGLPLCLRLMIDAAT